MQTGNRDVKALEKGKKGILKNTLLKGTLIEAKLGKKTKKPTKGIL